MRKKRFITCPELDGGSTSIARSCYTCKSRKKCWGKMTEREMFEYGVEYPEITKEPPFPEE